MARGMPSLSRFVSGLITADYLIVAAAVGTIAAVRVSVLMSPASSGTSSV